MPTIFDHLNAQGRIPVVVSTLGVYKVKPATSWQEVKADIAKKAQSVLKKGNLQPETRRRWNLVAYMATKPERN